MKVEKYEIFIDFNDLAETFEGRVKIYLINGKRRIKLDKEDIEVRKVLVNGSECNFEDRNDSLIISSNNQIKFIEIEYSGRVSKTLEGLYRAKNIFSTQFEATGARKVFPCLDNPNFKAKFKISVKVRKPYEVISNEDVESIEDLGEYRIFNFKETCEMSTYLVYIGIGEFKKLVEKNSIKFRAIVPFDKDVNKAKQSLNYTKKFFEFMQDYFKVKYPLSKLDIIAIPEFAAGAMENFGAITFREIFVLLSKSTSYKIKRRVMEVISHELVHQWFGNLVSPKDWKDLWLNESFATYLAYLVIDKVFPKEKILRDFFEGDYYSSLSQDSLLNTHPIKFKYRKKEEIDQLFDSITYGKGASILRMFFGYLGEENFRSYIVEYLNKFKFSNANTEDFLNIVRNHKNLFKSWIFNKGHPIIFAKFKKGKIVLTQKTFTYLKNSSKTIWPIPLFIKFDNRKEVVLFDKKKTSLNLKFKNFIFLNSDSFGYYRVFYDKKLLEAILKNKSKLNEFEKCSLIENYFSFLLADLISIDEFLKLVEKFKKDKDFLVIKEIVNDLSFLVDYLDKNKKVKKFTQEYLNYHYKRLSYKRREDLILLGTICTLYSKIDSKFRKELVNAYKNYFDVPPDLRLAYSISLVKVKGREGFEEVLKNIERAEDEDRIKLLSSLFYSEDKSLVALAFSLISSKSKKQDLPILIQSSLSEKKNIDIAWIWLKENLPNVISIFRGSYQPRRIMESIIPDIGLYKEAEIKEYLKKNKFEEAKIGIKTGFEILEVIKRLRKKYNF
ncbi:MAG: M1 family metallopeptidase [Candidatus Aenigmatarchaeota archaeon]